MSSRRRACTTTSGDSAAPTWVGRRLEATSFTLGPRGSLPPVDDAGVVVNLPFERTVYMNLETLSYSTAFWDYERWEKEIEWMALHGVNTPMAPNGVEQVWMRVLTSKDFGLKDSEVEEWFGDPAHQAWARNGAAQVVDRGRPKKWLKRQWDLQRDAAERGGGGERERERRKDEEEGGGGKKRCSSLPWRRLHQAACRGPRHRPPLPGGHFPGDSRPER